MSNFVANITDGQDSKEVFFSLMAYYKYIIYHYLIIHTRRQGSSA